MVTAGLCVEDLVVSYRGDDGPVIAVNGADLVVEPGEVLCVLGPSGCGKSTLLRAITGLVTPSRGSIRWGGEDLSEVPVHRRRFGLMFQDHALFPHANVEANVAFGLRMAKTPRDEIASRVAEMLELVGLGEHRERRVDELSGGERQRVALARSLAPDPRLLLLDEPLGSLDRGLRDRLVGELRSLFSSLGTTVLYVTHDQDEAITVSDRLAVMRSGTIEQVGSPLEVWRRPANTFVASFLGATNFVRAPVVGGSAKLPFGMLPVPSLQNGEVTVLLRTNALRTDRDGAVRGMVLARRFVGDVIVSRVLVGELELDVTVDAEPAPSVGDAIRLSFDPSNVLIIDA